MTFYLFTNVHPTTRTLCFCPVTHFKIYKILFSFGVSCCWILLVVLDKRVIDITGKFESFHIRNQTVNMCDFFFSKLFVFYIYANTYLKSNFYQFIHSEIFTWTCRGWVFDVDATNLMWTLQDSFVTIDNGNNLWWQLFVLVLNLFSMD